MNIAFGAVQCTLTVGRNISAVNLPSPVLEFFNFASVVVLLKSRINSARSVNAALLTEFVVQLFCDFI